MMPIYHIRIKGHLNQHWLNWFGGLTIRNEPNGEAVLAGQIHDQAALHGVLIKIRDLGLPLIALCQVTTERSCSEPSATGAIPHQVPE
jgi:hypothetical protein